MAQCQCKCGNETNKGNRYVHGHNRTRPKLKLSDVATKRDPATGCLLFLGHINKVSGYGYLAQVPAHRVAYEEAFGQIPEGLAIDHVYDNGCRHRNCIEPTHLEAVTQRENNRRAAKLHRATHCKRGHALTGSNLHLKQRYGYVERVCIECRRIRRNASYHRCKSRRIQAAQGVL